MATNGAVTREISNLALATNVDDGLPLAALDRLAASIAPGEPDFVHRLVPRASLARRRQTSDRLSAETSAKVARLESLWTFAIEVWGSEHDARAFLAEPHPMLDDRVPLALILMNEFGGEAVKAILGRLQYGSAA